MIGGFRLVSILLAPNMFPLTLLSELQLRRPNKDKYRLDKLLQRKAREGVKIFVIV